LNPVDQRSDGAYLTGIPLSVGIACTQEAIDYRFGMSCSLEHLLADIILDYRNLDFLQDAGNTTTCPTERENTSTMWIELAINVTRVCTSTECGIILFVRMEIKAAKTKF
jgi:hypothetical protein